MRTRLSFAALLSFALTLMAGAQTPGYTMSPQSGSASGGTLVTLHVPNAAVVSSVYFGSVLVGATRVDSTTLATLTPAQLPGSATGTVPVKLWVFGASVSTGLTFTYDNDAELVFERLLLPVFTPPVTGAFGSEFRTDFRASLVHGDSANIFGLARQCVILCVEGPDIPHSLTPEFPELDVTRIEPVGTPGQFIYVPREELGRAAMNLRAYDTSRAAQNFGTEIPIVREGDFFSSSETLALVGIPSDPRFRKTLRVYGAGQYGAGLVVSIEGNGVKTDHSISVPPSSPTHPGYVELSSFPTGTGYLTVTIYNPVPHGIVPASEIWAFVSVTNNETQHITTITPQPR
ncbi:MAG: IPT/TIG domain-containing protein [Acidobacteriota bacterium]